MARDCFCDGNTGEFKSVVFSVESGQSSVSVGQVGKTSGYLSEHLFSLRNLTCSVEANSAVEKRAWQVRLEAELLVKNF
jgi:hypothetical protein